EQPRPRPRRRATFARLDAVRAGEERGQQGHGRSAAGDGGEHATRASVDGARPGAPDSLPRPGL
ncbi:MAG: hypothetical protein AVDCRST_MAG68-5070, partial [uncultured Gemmatimonadetes bacterium]